jgi:hypothetical protein
MSRFRFRVRVRVRVTLRLTLGDGRHAEAEMAHGDHLVGSGAHAVAERELA